MIDSLASDSGGSQTYLSKLNLICRNVNDKAQANAEAKADAQSEFITAIVTVNVDGLPLELSELALETIAQMQTQGGA